MVNITPPLSQLFVVDLCSVYVPAIRLNMKANHLYPRWASSSRLRMRRIVSAAVVMLNITADCASAQTIVSTGSVWRYLADGSGQAATNWRGAAFDDSGWQTGPAPLGFGGDGHATVIASEAGPLTSYFRHRFSVSDWREFRTLTLRIRRDDGIVIYINNREMRRDNMPAGVVNYLTPAIRSVLGAEEHRFVQFGAAPSLLANGTNVLAVELHQTTGGQRDGSFDLELVGNLPLGPPSISFVSPEDGEVLQPGEITLSADAADVDGHITFAAFYVDDQLLGTDPLEPFSFPWNPLPGRYRLRAEAIDYSGRRGSSAAVHVQVGEIAEDRLVRGPYLQSGSPTSIVVRWRTDWFTQSGVFYGTNLFDFEDVALDEGRKTDHAIRITGLRPNTKYYYAISTENQILASGTDCGFVTSPTNSRPIRVWVIGDAGTGDQYQEMVRDAYYRYADGAPTDLWLMLGDNAYECGTDEQYQRGVFNIYSTLLRRAVVWPTIGNHDAGCFGNGDFPYLDIFTLPAQGEAGGTSSGTERYYSFDYGNIHFVCLDAQSSSRLTGGPMLTWLEQDLAGTDKDWIIAFWHQPPYSFGTHSSDAEHDLIEMREHAVPILEKHGADLVLCGHSHNYERSYLLNGHYGHSSTFSPDFVLDSGFGREGLDGPYQKPAGGLGANRGAVYAVCGCSGQGGYFTPRYHPAMRVSLTGFGSMVLDIDGLRLGASFLTEKGEIADYFTIRKGPPTDGVKPYLHIGRTGRQAHISWPTSLRPFRLEMADRLGDENTWTEVIWPRATAGRRHQVIVNLEGSNKVFRLKADK